MRCRLAQGPALWEISSLTTESSPPARSGGRAGFLGRRGGPAVSLDRGFQERRAGVRWQYGASLPGFEHIQATSPDVSDGYLNEEFASQLPEMW